MKEYHEFLYDGPVMEFNLCVYNHWKGRTMAPTEAKAKSNLAYQYKKEHNKTPATKISLPGKLTIVS